MLEAATRPLRGVLPPAGELPTRRIPRAVPNGGPNSPNSPNNTDDPHAPGDPDERPTAQIGAASAADREPRPGGHPDLDPWDGPAVDPGPRPSGPPDPPAASPQLRRTAWPERPDPRTLKRALLAAGASTLAPGAGQMMLHRRRLGAVLLACFAAVLVLAGIAVAAADRTVLLESVLSTRVLTVASIVSLGVAVAWIAVIVHAYLIGRPERMRTGRQVVGAATVAALCLTVAAPFGLTAYAANSQRSLLATLFPSAGADAAAAIGKPRLNIMLVGSDAGPDRTGTRTDTMMVASIDTKTGRTTLFGLPRNIGFARFPPGSPMAERFPNGFHDRSAPLSGDYLLNGVYAYGHEYPQLAPPGPTADPGLNLLQSSVSYMLGLPIDYQIVVDMAGFAALIDALGGLTVDVGPERITIGGIGPHGQKVKPQGYIEPGVQQLTGEQALAFARSRTDSSDYVRMGRQRCLIQYVLEQKTPTDLLTNFQAVAKATTDNVSTNIPREVLPALVALAGSTGFTLESIAFDPNLADPNTPDGRFNTYDPDVSYMRHVVQEATTRSVRAPTPPADAAGTGAGTGRAEEKPAAPAVPQSLAESCTPSAAAAAAAANPAPAVEDPGSGIADGTAPAVTRPPSTIPRSASSATTRNSAAADSRSSTTESGSTSSSRTSTPSTTRSRAADAAQDSSRSTGNDTSGDGT